MLQPMPSQSEVNNFLITKCSKSFVPLLWESSGFKVCWAGGKISSHPREQGPSQESQRDTRTQQTRQLGLLLGKGRHMELHGGRCGWRSRGGDQWHCQAQSGSRRGRMLEQPWAIHSQSYQSNDPAPLTCCLKSCSGAITQNFNAPLYPYRQANSDVLHHLYTSPSTPENPIGKVWREFRELWGLMALCKMSIQAHSSSVKYNPGLLPKLENF